MLVFRWKVSKKPIGAIVTVGVTIAVSILELLLIDRKYGLFSGGFGQSRVVKYPSELIEFGLGYGISQFLLALVIWWVAVRLTRKQFGWPTLLLFSVLMGGGLTLVLALQYQLHSFFSDAVSFALLKQLGGGSLLDALLFGLSEVGVALMAIVGGVLLTWMIWRFLKQRFPVVSNLDTPRNLVSKRSFQLAVLLFLTFAAVVPRLGDNTAYGLSRPIVWKTMISALDAFTDFDGDGYGLFGILYDNSPFDAKRHPYAFNVTGNKIDVDSLASNLLIEDVPAPRVQTKLPMGASNLVFVVMESTRGDTLGKRIDGKVVAPNLEALAASGSAAVPSFSHVGFTVNSLKSMFSGQLEPKNGDPSLFRDLKLSGYQIGIISGQPESFGDISATLQMRENANFFVDAETLKENRAFSFAAKGSLLVDEKFLLEAFDQEYGLAEKWKQPVFLYFNFQSPHFPYDHPGVAARILNNPIPRESISSKNQDWLARTYWNAVSNSDYWLGELVVRLKKIGVWESTILFVSGDHGEELFEGGFLGHGHMINQYQSQTFLVASRPGVIPRRAISLSDYRNIVLDALAGRPPQENLRPAFMYIGSLEKPTQIGIADGSTRMTTLRFDTREVCFIEQKICRSYNLVSGEDRLRVDSLVQRWVSELWAVRKKNQ